MNNLTFELIAKARRKKVHDATKSPRGKGPLPALPHKGDALVQRFIRFSSFAFCAPAIPSTLFDVKQNRKIKGDPHEPKSNPEPQVE
jgi:hypothetical protein